MTPKENKIDDGESWFETMVETAHDAVITVNSQGNIQFWNSAASEMFGYSKSEIIGKNIKTLMPDRYKLAHSRGMKKFFTTGEGPLMGRPIELEAVKKDQTEFPIDLTLSAWVAGGETIVAGIIRDITERKRTEDQIGRAKEFTDALNKINDEISSTLNFDQIMESVAAEASRAIGCDKGAIYLREDERGWLLDCQVRLSISAQINRQSMFG